MKIQLPLACCLFAALFATSSFAEIPSIDKVLSEITPAETAQAISQDPRWVKPKKIVAFLPSFARPPQIENLQSWLNEGLGAELVLVDSAEEMKKYADDVQALLGYCGMYQGKYPQLRWVQSISAGVESCAANTQFNNKRVIAMNGAATSGPAIAEWVIGSMFLLQRHFQQYYLLQQNKEWPEWREKVAEGYEINGKTMLVVGLGGIGKQIAWRAKALGMTVLATRNSSRNGPEYVDYVGLSSELSALAKRADVVVNSAPLTDKTRGIFNQEFFKDMPSNAIFINIGRGGSVVQDDLIAALKQGDIRAAALDVTSPEPLPVESELWGLPNVFITPHHSSRTDESALRRWVLIKENMRRFVAGEAVFNLVDLQRGY